MTTWQSPHGRPLPAIGDRTLIMGVINVTPDSFSDGGLHLSPERAAEHAGSLLREGADILDIGAESTRPGARPISAEEEIERLLPVITSVRKRYPDAPVSADTYKAGVARAALEAGADIINDVWGLTADMAPRLLETWRKTVADNGDCSRLEGSPMARVAAEWRCPAIIMHNRAKPEYDDFWPELFSDIQVGVALAKEAGVPSHQIWLDPGFGFGKEPRHNLEVLKRLERFCSLGYPVLLGTSRKSTLGLILDRPVDRRLEGTAATAVWGIARGCHMVRVHDVAQIRPFITMADAVRLGLDYPQKTGGAL